MMLELMTIGICAGGWHCGDMTQAYYEYNKDLKTIVEKNTKKVTNTITPTYYPAIIIAASAIGAIAGATGSIVLDRHFSIEIGKDDSSAIINREALVFKMGW